MVTAIFDAIQAELNMPMIAVDSTTTVDLTSKWEGTSANDLVVSIDGPTDAGVSFAFSQPSGGLVNPDVSGALAQVGNIWETMFLNCLEIADTTTLDLYSAFNEGRWGALKHMPSVIFTGNNIAVVSSAIAISDARKTDRSNAQLVAPGSTDLPFITAARQLARIVKVANNIPAHDYGGQAATGLAPGLDSEQWDYLEQDQAVKGGSSTVDVIDGVVTIGDTVTFYHPTGDPTPAYRFVKTIVKLQNILFNIALIFNSAEWNGAPLIPDDQETSEPTAKKPKMAVADVSAMIDSLASKAILSDPKTAKANTFAEIDSGNPDRLNVSTTVQVSGNTNIKSIDLNWGFFFGTPTIVG
jgi:phage tail sheath gpL-like